MTYFLIPMLLITSFCIASRAQTFSSTYTMNWDEGTILSNGYIQFGGTRSYKNDYYWASNIFFKHAEIACNRPRVAIYKNGDLEDLTWRIGGTQQSVIYLRRGNCTESWFLTDFELAEYDLQYNTITEDLHFYYLADFYSSCIQQETIGFYLQCQPSAIQPYTPSLGQNYYLNITNASLQNGVYEDHSVSFISSNAEQKAYTWFRINEGYESCYSPHLSVSAQMATGILAVYIEMNGVEHLLGSVRFSENNSCTEQLILTDFDITSFLEQDMVDGVLDVRLEPIVNDGDITCSSNDQIDITMIANVTLSCLLTDFHAVYDPKITTETVDIEATDDKFKYHSFTQLVNSSFTAQPIFVIY
eukprot:959390_1